MEGPDGAVAATAYGGAGLVLPSAARLSTPDGFVSSSPCAAEQGRAPRRHHISTHRRHPHGLPRLGPSPSWPASPIRAAAAPPHLRLGRRRIAVPVVGDLGSVDGRSHAPGEWRAATRLRQSVLLLSPGVRFFCFSCTDVPCHISFPLSSVQGCIPTDSSTWIHKMNKEKLESWTEKKKLKAKKKAERGELLLKQISMWVAEDNLKTKSSGYLPYRNSLRKLNTISSTRQDGA